MDVEWLQPLQETADQMHRTYVNNLETLMRHNLKPERIQRGYNSEKRVWKITLHDPKHAVDIVFDDGTKKQEKEDKVKSRINSLINAVPVGRLSAPTTRKASHLPIPEANIGRRSSVLPDNIKRSSVTQQPQSLLPLPEGIISRSSAAADNTKRSSVTQQPQTTLQTTLTAAPLLMLGKIPPATKNVAPTKETDYALLGKSQPKERIKPLVSYPSDEKPSISTELPNVTAPSKEAAAAVLGVKPPKQRKTPLISKFDSVPEGVVLPRFTLPRSIPTNIAEDVQSTSDMQHSLDDQMPRPVENFVQKRSISSVILKPVQKKMKRLLSKSEKRLPSIDATKPLPLEAVVSDRVDKIQEADSSISTM